MLGTDNHCDSTAGCFYTVDLQEKNTQEKRTHILTFYLLIQLCTCIISDHSLHSKKNTDLDIGQQNEAVAIPVSKTVAYSTVKLAGRTTGNLQH